MEVERAAVKIVQIERSSGAGGDAGVKEESCSSSQSESSSDAGGGDPGANPPPSESSSGTSKGDDSLVSNANSSEHQHDNGLDKKMRTKASK